MDDCPPPILRFFQLSPMLILMVHNHPHSQFHHLKFQRIYQASTTSSFTFIFNLFHETFTAPRTSDSFSPLSAETWAGTNLLSAPLPSQRSRSSRPPPLRPTSPPIRRKSYPSGGATFMSARYRSAHSCAECIWLSLKDAKSIATRSFVLP